MSTDPAKWTNHSPGNLDDCLPEVKTGDVSAVVDRAATAGCAWAALSMEERWTALQRCQAGIRQNTELHAQNISREVGKPIREARAEVGAVIAKFDLTFADAREWITERNVYDGPHPASIRHHPYGVAAVIAPFNFPLHLGHGAAVAYLLSGNTVVFKPSPLAAVTAQAYAEDMCGGLPEGVFQLLQGWGQTSRNLCLHPKVRAVCFTGSAEVGRGLARDLVEDIGKSLALELGGKNALIICEDANIEKAASFAADGFCLTSGQRCNATTRILVQESRLEEFIAALKKEVGRYRPGFPLDEKTTMGPLVNEKAVARYRQFTGLPLGEWVLPGKVLDKADGYPGYYVEPAVACCRDSEKAVHSPLYQDEAFAPIALVVPFHDESHALHLHNATPYGLSASIFTASRENFESIGKFLQVGNLYWNLPTTFSPSTLPFGGWGISGNGKPGGRGFIRHTVQEQAVQLGL